MKVAEMLLKQPSERAYKVAQLMPGWYVTHLVLKADLYGTLKRNETLAEHREKGSIITRHTSSAEKMQISRTGDLSVAPTNTESIEDSSTPLRQVARAAKSACSTCTPLSSL